MVYLFDVTAYFILLRETVECVIIVSVVLGFLDKIAVGVNSDLIRRLKRQVWWGAAAGLAVSFIIGAVFISIFYTVARNLYEKSEQIWEGVFSLLASIVLTIMAMTMSKVAQWKRKWEEKLTDQVGKQLDKHEKGEKWALFLLMMSIVAREGLESVIFIAGIGFNKSPTGLPIPIITGILTGCLIGYLIYRGTHTISLLIFFNAMTVLLFFMGAGFFTNSIGEFQEHTGSGEDNIVWSLDCCNPDTNQGWGIAHSLFGWRQVATVGTTLAYFLYWAAVLLWLVYLHFSDRRKETFKMVIKNESLDVETKEKIEISETSNGEEKEKIEISEVSNGEQKV